MEKTRVSEIKGGRCGWLGCTAHYTGKMPPGWSCLVVHDDAPGQATEVVGVRLMLDLSILTWRHDKVLCPEHVLALDQLLELGTGS